jgi:hypothetical protein
VNLEEKYSDIHLLDTESELRKKESLKESAIDDVEARRKILER